MSGKPGVWRVKGPEQGAPTEVHGGEAALLEEAVCSHRSSFLPARTHPCYLCVICERRAEGVDLWVPCPCGEGEF